MIAKPCIGCGTPTSGSRCPACRPTGTRKAPDHVHSNTARWKALSKKLRKASPFCEWCGGTERLQLDHIVPVAAAEELAYAVENCRVLCKPCNGRRQDNYTHDEAHGVLERLQAAYNRRPTRAGRERIAAAQRACDQGGCPKPTAVPSAGKACSQLHMEMIVNKGVDQG